MGAAVEELAVDQAPLRHSVVDGLSVEHFLFGAEARGDGGRVAADALRGDAWRGDAGLRGVALRGDAGLSGVGVVVLGGVVARAGT